MCRLLTNRICCEGERNKSSLNIYEQEPAAAGPREAAYSGMILIYNNIPILS